MGAFRDPDIGEIKPMRATTGHRGFTHRQIGKVITYTLLIAVAVVLTIPVVYLISTSLKLESEYIAEELQFFPQKVQWQNYYLALTMIDFGRYALNSFLLATSFATLTVMAPVGLVRQPLLHLPLPPVLPRLSGRAGRSG